MGEKVELPPISEGEQTPLVRQLLAIIERQALIIQKLQGEVEVLRDEVARLKKQKARPRITPSRLPEQDKAGEGDESKDGKRPGSEKRSKTGELPIHEEMKIAPAEVPPGSVFKGYQEYVVQGLRIEAHNTRYLLERWLTPAGAYVVGKLPAWLEGRHFDDALVSFILYQHHHARVTQPLLLEQLREYGVDISAGELALLLTEGKDAFHEEKGDILAAGLEVSGYVHVDDTGARHAGRNGYCTHIGNELFAWFETTDSKSRLNFLQLLRTGPADYVVNEDALAYLRRECCPQSLLALLRDHPAKSFAQAAQWQAHLASLGIRSPRHVKLATEAAVLGSILHHGLPRGLMIVSDDAGQFNVLNHGLCWVHAERAINKLIPVDDQEKQAIEAVRGQIWTFYAQLKAYRRDPRPEAKDLLRARFDEIFTQTTCRHQLNVALRRLHKNKAELLLVLEHPELPLHNNLSESDIREYVTRRKISGGTRSVLGKRCRDTFTSLKKTCRKLGISFWQYLRDRIRGCHQIPPLSRIIRERAAAFG